jgi:hypothetical protein
MLAALFVAVPLGLYAITFSYETFAAFRRLAKNSNDYVSATWEITHTLLVLALTNFTWLWSEAMIAVAQAAYWGLIIAAAAFVVRAILYVYLFHAAAAGKHRLAGWLFALSHLVMLAGLVYSVVAAFRVLSSQSYAVNDQLIPYMWPALIASLVICAIPIWKSYRSK